MSKEVADEIRQRLGANVRKRREELGLKQFQLAEAVGCDQGGLSKIENGLVYPELATVTAIAEALGTTYLDLLKADDEVVA